jgi:hypothetical protein
MAKKRKNEETQNVDPADQTIKPDTTSGMVDLAYMGTVAFNVNHLETRWETGYQREIDSEHIEKLLASFRVGIQLFAPAARMSAACSRQTFQKILSQFKQEHPDRDASVEHLELLSKVHHRGSSFTDFIYLVNYPESEPKPILYAGQHRRRALIQAVESQENARKLGQLKGVEEASIQNACVTLPSN